MPVLANMDVIFVIIVIVSVISQIIKGAKKVTSQAPGTPSGSGSPKPVDAVGEQRDFVAPDDALQEFLRTLGSGEKPAARAAAASPIQKKSARRGLVQAQAAVKNTPRRKVVREVKPQALPISIPTVVQAPRDHVQEAVVLEKFAARRTNASILGDAIRKDLLNADAIRKAIVLREVLGPPVALR